jgi:putative oxidoreductase
MIRWLNRMQPGALCLLRLAVGAAMLYHGWSKVVPSGGIFHGHLTSALDRFASYVVSLGMPRWLGYVSAATEFLGGLLLLLGLLTRFCAFMVLVDMLVALVKVNIHHGYEGSEYTLALIAMAFMLLTAGSGALSLDRRLGIS